MFDFLNPTLSKTLLDSAEKGDPEAQYAVAFTIFHAIELNTFDSDLVERALGYLRELATQAYLQGIAACELGSLYCQGKFVEKDYKKALLWFRTSILSHQPYGYISLADCFFHGYGVQQDYIQAYDYYFKSSFFKTVEAYFNIATMFRNGLFVIKDETYALMLYTHILDSELGLFFKYGIPTDALIYSFLYLGECYLFGYGTDFNVMKANDCFSKVKQIIESNNLKPKLSSFFSSLLEASPFSDNTSRACFPINEESMFDFAPTDCQIAVIEELHDYENLTKKMLLTDSHKKSDLKKLQNLYTQISYFEKDYTFMEFLRSKIDVNDGQAR